jgi:protein ImuB
LARASHLPERAQILLPLLDDPPAAPESSSPGPAETFRTRAARPARLLVRPEPIEAVALVPDDPPRQFRWRGRTHQVRRAEGPERIAPEWWRRDGATRDYYRIEDDTGSRFWVYRDGLYDTPTAPRWYLHGLFA